MSRFKFAGTTEHDFSKERLSAYLDGELTPREQKMVEHHLDSCPTCQWELDTLGRTIQWTRALPTLAVPRVFTIPVPAEPVRPSVRRWNLLPVLQGATVAIALLLVFAVAGDFLSSTLPIGGASDAAWPQEAAPARTEVAMEVTVAVEAAAVEPEQEIEKMVAETVVETVVVESEVLAAPIEAPAAEGISPTEQTVGEEAMAPTATPEPPSDRVAYESTVEAEVAEEAMLQAEPTALDAGAAMAEGESVPMLAEEGPVAGGGEQALTMPEPSPPVNLDEPGTASTATELALAVAGEQDEPELRTSGEAGVNWLRVVQVSLGGILVLLAAATILLTIERRRAR